MNSCASSLSQRDSLVHLPHDILLKIYEYSDLVSFLQLRLVHPLLNSKIDDLSNYILSKESHKLLFASKLHFYAYMNNQFFELLIDCKKRYLRYVSKSLSGNADVIMLNMEVMRHLHMYVYSPCSKINNVFVNLMSHYIQHGTLLFYPNKFDLIAFHVFSTALYTKSTLSINHVVRILDRLALFDNNWNGICIDYFTSVCNFSFLNINFDTLYTMTKYAVNFTTLWKMFTFKPLNLSCTYLLSNIESGTKINKILSDICSLKHQYPNDELIGHNYNELRTLLGKSSVALYNSLLFIQKLLVNKDIYITHPINKNKIRFQSRQYIRLMQRLNHASTETSHQPNHHFYSNCIRKVRREIAIKQDKLIHQFFD